MTELKPAAHLFTPGKACIEVWQDGRPIAAIYSSESGIRVISKFQMEIARDKAPPEAINITILAAR